MTWTLVVTILGVTAWQLGSLTEAECEAGKAVLERNADAVAARQGSIEWEGRVVTRADVKIECVPERD